MSAIRSASELASAMFSGRTTVTTSPSGTASGSVPTKVGISERPICSSFRR